MARISLEELRRKAAKGYDDQKSRLRHHYRYAKNKGFSVAEAKILSSQPLEEIDRLARERDGEK